MARGNVAAWLLACWLAFLPGMARAAEAAVGEVLVFGGQPFVEAGGARHALAVGEAVHVGDTLDVPAGAKLKLRMADGSVLALASGSRLTIQTYAVGGGAAQRDAKLSLATGLLHAVVASFAAPSHFEVDTAAGVAAVRGTDWFIEAEPKGGTQVGVLTGKVSLASAATERSVSIPARWGARVEAGMDPVPARVWAQSEFDAVIARTDVH